MSKLPSIGARELIHVAEKLEFTFDHQKGSHAVFYREADKRRLVVPVHKGHNLKPGTLHAIIEELGVTIDEFDKML